MDNSGDQINEISAALAKAQKTMGNPEKNQSVEIVTKTGRTIKFDYADLGALREVSKDPLADNGLSICHLLIPQEGKLYLKTVLMHSSGQSIASLFPLSGSADMKEFAGEITYAKRYNKAAILDLFADDDKDGDELQTPKPQRTAQATGPAQVQTKTTAPKVNPNCISPDQLKRLMTIATNTGWKDDEVKAFLKAKGYASRKDILKKDYNQIVKEIEFPVSNIPPEIEGTPPYEEIPF